MLTYGFFDSLDGDRKYDSEQFAGFLDGIVYDGVYQAVGDKFFVSPLSGMKVKVGTGRAWFKHTWTLNTSDLVLELDPADPVYARIDEVVIEINKNTRENSIKVIKGEPALVPMRPQKVKTSLINQYTIAQIVVPALAEELEQENITFMVNTEETPLCSALSLSGIPSGGETGQVLAKSSHMSGAVGWYDINNLPTDDWTTPAGIKYEDIVEYWQFLGANSVEVALRGLKNSYLASRYTDGQVGFHPGYGIHIPENSMYGYGLRIPDIKNKTIKSVAIKYHNANTYEYGGGDNYNSNNTTYSVRLFYRSPVYCLYLSFNDLLTNGGNNITLHKINGPVIVSKIGTYKVSTEKNGDIEDGIISANLYDNPSIFLNGEKQIITSVGSGNYLFTSANYSSSNDNGCNVGNGAKVTFENTGVSSGPRGSVYIEAIILYSVELEDNEHIQLYQMMNEMSMHIA